jgi:hypothetical protein
MSALVHMNVFHLNKSGFRRVPGCAAIFAIFWLGMVEIETAVPASNRDQVAPTSDRPWAPPNLPAYENTLQKGTAKTLKKGRELVDTRKEYTLADLIDLAEELNPATRVAWQNARQALALVGVSINPPITLICH